MKSNCPFKKLAAHALQITIIKKNFKSILHLFNNINFWYFQYTGITVSMVLTRRVKTSPQKHEIIKNTLK